MTPNPTTPSDFVTIVEKHGEDLSQTLFYVTPEGKIFHHDSNGKDTDVTQYFITKPHLAEVLEGMKKNPPFFSDTESGYHGYEQALIDLATTLELNDK